MIPNRNLSLVSLLASSGLAALALAATGCHVGNQEVDAPATTPDTVSGNYAMAPTTLQVYATVNGQINSGTAVPSQIPARVSAILTNPVTIQLQDSSNGQASIYAPIGATDSFTVYFQSDNQTFTANSSSPVETLWSDPACTIQENLEIQGRLQPLGSTSSLGIFDGTSMTITGRISNDVWVEDQISGNCAATLQALAQCYQSASACGESTSAENQADQQLVQELYQLYIQAGAMTVQDIPNVTDLSYQVSYQ